MNRTAMGWLAGLIFAISGCDSGGSKPGNQPEGRTEQSILGVYENTIDKIGVELKADGKATTFIEGEEPYDTTWERDGADRIILHGADGFRMMYKFNSDGNLSDDMGLGSVLRKK